MIIGELYPDDRTHLCCAAGQVSPRAPYAGSVAACRGTSPELGRPSHTQRPVSQRDRERGHRKLDEVAASDLDGGADRRDGQALKSARRKKRLGCIDPTITDSGQAKERASWSCRTINVARISRRQD